MVKVIVLFVVIVAAACLLLLNTPLGKCVKAGYDETGMATSALYACVTK